MKIKLIKIVKPTKTYTSLVSNYQERLSAFCSLETLECKTSEQALRLLAEAKAKQGSQVVALDERGRQWSSQELAQFVQASRDNPSLKTLIFMVGGPYGLGDDLRALADCVWSLSKAVFPSDMAWLLLNEQLYRAFTIIHGTPYHHH